MYSRQRGSITVFLCLVLVIVLAMVGTVSEAARLQVAKTYAERGQQLAMEAEFTKYHQELYEDYKIFLREQKKDENTMDSKQFAESIQDYLLYSFQPQKDIQVGGVNIPLKNVDFMNLSTTECNVVDNVHITDEDGGLFENEITELMKYEIGSNALDSLFGSAEETGKTDTSMKVVNEKLKVEESVAEINETIIDLMEEVEGLTFEHGELKMEDELTIKIQPFFAKLFCTVEKSPSNVGINHATVWDSLCDRYINPKAVLKSVITELQGYQDLIDEVKTLSEEIEKKQEKLDKLKEAKEPDEEKIKKLTDELDELNKKKVKAEDKLKSGFTLSKRKAMDKKIRDMIGISKQINKHVEKAISLIGDLKDKKAEVMPKVTAFQTTLDNNKGNMNPGVYEGVKSDYDDIKAYVNNIDEKTGADKSVVGDIVAMQGQLESNKAILDQVAAVKYTPIGENVDKIPDMQKSIGDLSAMFDAYSIKDLKFDYTNLTINSEKQDGGIFSTFGDLISDGLLGVVVDDVEKISKDKINTSSLPSVMHAKGSGDTSSEPEEDDDKLQDTIVNGDKEHLSDSMKGEETEENINEVLTSGEKLINKGLVSEYIKNYFKKYEPEEETGKKEEDKEGNKEEKKEEVKETALDYEQEYIICGRDNDYDNLKTVVRKTIFYRVIFNYLCLLSDTKARAKAEATATAMVGFTGFAPLISLTKQLILITWAFEESLVDTRALLDGKKLPLYKTEATFQVKYEEMLSMTKETIKKKAANVSQKSSVGAMEWGDYLRLYTLTMDKEKILYRMMDLIQVNIQKRYSKSFQLDNCIYGIKTKVTYHMPMKVLSIPIFRKETKYTGNGCDFTIEKECTY